MDKEHAPAVLTRELRAYRAKTYSELKELVGDLYAYEVPAATGPPYQGRDPGCVGLEA